MVKEIEKSISEDVPAIEGGIPVKQTPFTRAKRYGDEELQQLKEALDQGTLFYSHGCKVSQLEKDFAEKNGVKYAVACSSGTASIHAAMMAAGISPGDEVITTPITDMGSIIPIMFQGGVPVFADLDPNTYVIDPESVDRNITPKTKAILAVHLWGNACNLKALGEIAKKHNLILIEDCAQAFGCTYDGKPIGTIGAIGCFSYNEFKHISCGDGGIIITNDDSLGRRLRLATDKCYDRSPGVAVRNATFLAANYRMTELQGAVGVAQLKKLDSIVERRRRWCEALSSKLEGTPGISLPQPTEGCNPSWWFYMMRVQSDVLGVDVDKFAEALKAEGVPVGTHYIVQCVYEYPLFINHSAFERGSHPFESRTYGKGLCPNAEKILETCMILGVNEGYTQQDLEETATAIKRVAKWFRSK